MGNSAIKLPAFFGPSVSISIPMVSVSMISFTWIPVRWCTIKTVKPVSLMIGVSVNVNGESYQNYGSKWSL